MKFEISHLATQLNAGPGIGWLLASPIGPRIHLAPDTGDGQGEPDASKNDTNGDAGGDDQGAANGAGGNDDGKQNKPTDEEARLLKDVMKQKDRNATLKKDLEERDARLKLFDGLDPVKAREAIQRMMDAEREAAEKAGDFERVKTMMADAHKKDLEARDARIAELESALASNIGVIDELTIGNAFANSQFINEKLVLSPGKSRQIYGAHFGIENGKLVAFDKPAGVENRTKLVDGAGETLSFEAALQKLVDADPDRERIIRSTKKPGAGSATMDRKVDDTPKEKLFGVERIAAALLQITPASK